MMEKILEFITNYLPGRFINGDNGEAYLERYFLFSFFGLFTVHLHRFIDDNPARGLHNHPFKWSFSIILIGHYIEQYLHNQQILFRTIKWFNYIPSYRLHRVTKPHSLRKPIWTIFVHGKRVQDWGFFTNEKLIAGKVVNFNYSIYTASPRPDWYRDCERGLYMKLKRKAG